MRIIALAALALLALASAPAQAWNDFGHREVAAVAWSKLTPAARARAIALLKLNPKYDTWIAGVPAGQRDQIAFVRAATWPDAIKRDPAYQSDGSDNGDRPPPGPEASQNIGYPDHNRHKYWHFVDTPFSAGGDGRLPAVPVPNARDRIVLFLSVLTSSSPDALKSYDLTWLLHLVGDIHQPLHAATRVTAAQFYGDNGGNSVRICQDTLCNDTTNLHSVWDGVLGSQLDVASAMAAARQLPMAAPSRAALLDPAQWVQESLALAKSDVYQVPIRVGVGPYALTGAYGAHARQVGAAQIALAGARLAAVLNRDLTASGIRGTR